VGDLLTTTRKFKNTDTAISNTKWVKTCFFLHQIIVQIPVNWQQLETLAYITLHDLFKYSPHINFASERKAPLKAHVCNEVSCKNNCPQHFTIKFSLHVLVNSDIFLMPKRVCASAR